MFNIRLIQRREFVFANRTIEVDNQSAKSTASSNALFVKSWRSFPSKGTMKPGSLQRLNTFLHLSNRRDHVRC